MNKYLIKFLLDNEDNPLLKRYIEYFKVEMDWFIYSYGDHISKRNQRKQPSSLLGYYVWWRQNISSLTNQYKVNNDRPNIFSSISIEELEKEYNFYSSLLQPRGFYNIIGDYSTLKIRNRKQSIVNNGCIRDFIDKEFISEIEELRVRLLDKFRKFEFKGAFFHTDQYFESKFLIDIFKELGVPTFIFVHGLPGPYHKDIDDKSDYLMVWGERMREHYIAAGFEPEKVFAVGNRKYMVFDNARPLKNTLENVLVIPPSALEWHQNTWGDPIIVDRSMGVLYLHIVEKVLKKIGVKKARYRVHPSQKWEWTDKFLNHDFYQPDKDNLSHSLSMATLVIGSGSSLLFDAAANGVNYIMFEPQENGQTIVRKDVIPPFDGNDGIRVAKTEEELETMLLTEYVDDFCSLNKYMKSFDVDLIKKLLIK